MEHEQRNPNGVAAPARRALELFRARARVMLVTQQTLLVLVYAAAAAVALGAIDYFLRSPGWLRGAIWLGGMAALGWGWARFVRPAWRFRPGLTDVALRLEQSEAGRRAGLTGWLASGIELPGGSDPRGRMAAPVVSEATRRFSGFDPSASIRSVKLRQRALWLGAVLAPVVALTAMSPELARTGVLRVLAPWTDAQWPKRTEIADATAGRVHPLGTALALRAALIRSDGDPSEARVWAHYRLLNGGTAGPERRVLLTNQDRAVDVGDGSAEFGERGTARRGVLFERLIEPAGLSLAVRGAAREPGSGAEGELEYWFETSDDRTERRRITLVEPPAIVGATARVEAPAYAAALAAPPAPAARELDLGTGNDQRAIPAPMLAGSVVSVRVRFNKTVPGAPSLAETRGAFIESALGHEIAALEAQGLASVRFEPTEWDVTWSLRDSLRLPVRVVDTFGLGAAEESVFRFEAVQDRPPTAAVLRPEADTSVLPTAEVVIVGEGRDDVGLAAVGLERRLARRPDSSRGAPAEAISDWAPIAAVTAEDAGTERAAGEAPGVRQLTVTVLEDLSKLGVRPGDEVWVTAIAADIFELDGAGHGTARSATRRLLVIAEEEFVAQVWSELGVIRRSAVRLDEEQERLARQLATAGEQGSEQVRRGQAAITERLTKERQAIDELTRRVGGNRLNDPELDQVLGEAGRLLDESGRRSVRAAAAVEGVARAEAARGEDGGPGASPEERQRTVDRQREVRDSLGELMSLLDRGQDTYAVRRDIERLLTEQKELRERMAKSAAATTGKAPGELSPGEGAALESIAADQRGLAERAAEAVERMLDRQEKLQEKDRAAAQAVKQAADRAQRERLSDRMQEAAQQAQQNQGNSAMSQQDRAIQSMEEMLQDLQAAAGNRDEELRRVLTDLIRSIRALVEDQEEQLAALEEARGQADAGAALGALSEPLRTLIRNTLGVLDEATQAAQQTVELGIVADFIDKASDAQGAGLAALRRDPPDAAESAQKQTESLDNLRRALEEAQRLDDEAAERQAERKAAELRRLYRELLAEQVLIEQQTGELVGEEPTRRVRAAARALGEREAEIRRRLNEMLEETAELGEATVFAFAHERLDSLLAQIIQGLDAGSADSGIVRRQGNVARLLQSLIDSLDRSRGPDDGFRENPGDPAGGGGGASSRRPLVPPVAQLRLLRAMQGEALDLTRAAGEDDGGADLAEEAAGLQRSLTEKAEALLRQIEEQSSGARRAPGENPAPQSPAPRMNGTRRSVRSAHGGSAHA